MEGRGQSRLRALLLGGAVSTCLVVAVFLAARGAAAGTPRSLAPTDPPPTPVTTITSVILTTSFVPVPVTIPETTTITLTTTTTSTVRTTMPVPPPPVGTTRASGPQLSPAAPRLGPVTITSTAPNTKPPVKGSPDTVQTVPGSPTTVTATSTRNVPTVALPKKAIGKWRVVAGTAGVAVTSAAGFGFLLLRRRGRYGP